MSDVLIIVVGCATGFMGEYLELPLNTITYGEYTIQEQCSMERPLVTVPEHVCISGEETLGHALVGIIPRVAPNDGQAASFRKVFHRPGVGIQVLR